MKIKMLLSVTVFFVVMHGFVQCEIKPLQKLPFPQCAILSVAFCPDGKTLAILHKKRGILLYKKNTKGKWMHADTLESRFSCWKRFSDDEDYRVFFSDQSLDNQEYVGPLVFSPDGKKLICWFTYSMREWIKNEDGFWEFFHTDIQREFSPLVYSIVYSTDSRFMASLSRQGIMVYHHLSPSFGNCKLLEDCDSRSIAFSVDGEMLVSGSRTGPVKLWERCFDENWQSKLLPESERFSGDKLLEVGAVAFSPNGNELLCGFTDGKIKVWDFCSGKFTPAYELDGDTSVIIKIIFSPNGKTMATIGLKTKKLWKKNGSKKWVHAMNFEWEDIAFGPDSKTIAVVVADGSVEIRKNPLYLEQESLFAENKKDFYFGNKQENKKLLLRDIKIITK